MSESGPRLSPNVGDRFGSYRLDAVLGEGAQGTVYLATDVMLRRSTAIKFFKDRSGHTVALREARLVASMEHPNITRIYQFERVQSGWYFAMEHMEGGSVDKLLGAGSLGLEQSLQMAYQVAAALEHAHEQGVIHRDVKPHNLLLTKRGEVKLSDFGLARPAEPAEGGKPVGTPLYMAPEAWTGEGAAPADVYGLGACLYLFLTGAPPFPIRDREALRAAHLSAPVPELSGRVGQCADLIAACLAKDPAARPTAADARRRLRQCLDEAREQHSLSFLNRVVNRDLALQAIHGIAPFARLKSALADVFKASSPFVLVFTPYHFSVQLLLRSLIEVSEECIVRARLLADPGSNLTTRLEDLLSGRTDTGPLEAQLQLVHLHLQRALSPAELAAVFRALEGSGLLLSFVFTGELTHMNHTRDSIMLSGREALLHQLQLASLTVVERRAFVRNWADALDIDVRICSPDAARMLGESDPRGDFERQVHNATMISGLAGLRAVTTWSVLGARAHRGWVSNREGVRAPWRQAPQTWPNAAHRRRLEILGDTEDTLGTGGPR